MAKHSTLVGGSSAARYIGCIGSNELIKKVPPNTVGMAAWTGTMLHFIMETILGSDEEIDPHSFIGQMVELDETDPESNPVKVEVTEAHILEKIIPALEWFDNVLQPDEYWLEQHVAYDGELEGAHGIADVLYIKNKKRGTTDWKFGDNYIVDAEDNAQLKFYLGAALKYPWFNDPENDTFEACIVQPAPGNDDIESYTEFTRADLEALESDLIAAKRAKESGDTTLTRGSHCTFCPAKVICPEHIDPAKKALVDTPRNTLVGKTKKTYDHAALRAAYLLSKEFSPWAKAVADLVKAEFAAGRPIDGLKRIVAREDRIWRDEKKTVGWLRRMKFKASQYNTPSELLSVAKIEKLVGKGMRLDLVDKVANSFSIVDESDSKPAYDENEVLDKSADELAAALGTESKT